MRALLGMDEAELQQRMREMGEPAFRARQLIGWMYGRRETDFGAMTDLPEALRERLASRYVVTDVEVAARLQSTDGTEKMALRMADGALVEAAIMRYRHGISLCVSTQVGCAVGCVFCASGIGGRQRNLEAGEILAQWFLPQVTLDGGGERISHVVFMGMGEPLANYHATRAALRRLNDADGAGISYRRITLSTVGLVPEIRQLATEGIPLTLAVSLHAPNDYLRDRLIPINRRYPLRDLMEACRHYTAATGRRISFEYVMIDEVNDHPELARELGILLGDMSAHVNLIPLNPVPESPYRPSPAERVEEFRRVLGLMGVNATVRRSLGQDIEAACGQLRRRLEAEDGGASAEE